MRDGPAEKIYIGEDGTCSRDETHAPSGRALLRPGSDRESDCGMRDGRRHCLESTSVKRDAQIEDVRVEAGVRPGGIRIGEMRESIAKDVGMSNAASNPKARAGTSQEV